MWANADGHQNFWLDGTVLVLRVRRREFGRIAFGLGVGQLAIELGQLCQLLRRALDDPDRFATPFDGHFFARLQSRNIHLDRRTGIAIEDLLFDIDSARRTTVVIVTHDERLAARCDRQLRLEAGRLQP